jgi:hypothetical protein
MPLIQEFWKYSITMKIILIIIALIVAIIGIYKKDTWPLWATFGLSALLLIGALFQVIVERREAKAAARLKYAGTLESLSRILLSKKENIMPSIELGNGGTIFSFSKNPASIEFLKDNEIKVVVVDGQVKVSTIVRNSSGIIVAELLENEWKVNQNNSFDRNYSKNAIEVKDNTGDIVLQIKLINDRIQFQGKFYDGKGNGFSLGGSKDIDGGVMEFTGPKYPKLMLKIEPIFQYPSDNHLGQFRDSIK